MTTELPKTPPRIAASLCDPLSYAEAHGLHNDSPGCARICR